MLTQILLGIIWVLRFVVDVVGVIVILLILFIVLSWRATIRAEERREAAEIGE